MRLPPSTAPHPALADPRAGAAEGVGSAGATPALLLVDDRPENLLALEAVLEPLGVTLVRAGSGAAALQCLAMRDYAAVLLDVHMPEIDGFATARAIRAHDAVRAANDPAAAPTPIIFMTAADATDRVRLAEAYSLGAVDVLGKPLDPVAVRAKTQLFVELARARWRAESAAAARAVEVAELARVRAAEAALRASEARYRFLAESVPVMVWSARPDGLLDYATEQTAALLGREVRDVLGRGWTESLHPDDVRRTTQQWARSVTTGADYEVEFRLWSAATREYRWHLARARAQRDESGRIVGWVGTNTDVEEQKRSAESARRLQALTAALAGATTQGEVGTTIMRLGVRALGAYAGVVALRVEGADATPGEAPQLELLHSTGYPAEACMDVGRRWPLGAAIPIAEATRTGAPVFVESPEAWGARYLGGYAPARSASAAWAALPLTVEGETRGALLWTFDHPRAFRDDDRELFAAVAAQCAQALERARLREVERDARAAAEAANRAKSEFLSTMSHELRTPLNAINGYADLMQLGIRGPITADQQHDLSRIKRSSQHLLSLINDILNFTKLEAGQVDFRMGDVALDAVVADVESLMKPQLAAKEITYSQDAGVGRDGGPLVVHADPERLRQVLVNLLTNAVKFTARGGTVSLTCAAGDDVVYLRVRDSGRGIPADHLATIFEPFVQVDRHLTEGSQQGVGLGLAISRDLARRMGGDLTAESEVGAGSTFTLRMPRSQG